MHGQFAQLAKNDPRIDLDLRRFLSHAYNLKAVADYETGAGSDIPLEKSAAAIATAARFVDCIAGLLGEAA